MDESPPGSSWTCPASRLVPGQAASFRLRCGDRDVEGFVVNHDGRFFAYVNRCAHAGTTLDWWPNEFFAEDGRHLICATHGAVYLPDTGLCVAGPCPGAALTPLPVARQGDTLVIACPEDAREPRRRHR
ncbi:MAG: Rieske 2Fe-2S domain-containing protein [Candidatus Rokubacteria bacterium]|nr:Rieske 2Fe-2S domain-containing protein [Candidatus Rokubacteria bacterium]